MNKHYLREDDYLYTRTMRSDDEDAYQRKLRRQRGKDTVKIVGVILACIAIVAAITIASMSEAEAAEACVSWVAPTECVDNVKIGTGECLAITGYEVERATNSAGPWTAVQTVAPSMDNCDPTKKGANATNSYRVLNLGIGTHLLRIRAAAGSAKSDPSGVGTKVVVQGIPKAPTMLTVDTVAYRLNQNWNSFALERVGTVDLLTPCSSAPGNGTNAGMNVLADRNDVKLDAGKTRPNAPLAKCALVAVVAAADSN